MDRIERPENNPSEFPQYNYNTTVDGFTDNDVLTSTYALNRLFQATGTDDYAKFSFASVIRNPWYNNPDAQKDRTFTIADKTYELKYSRTVVTERFIADEYSYVNNEKIRFRYYTNSDVLVEIVGINDASDKFVRYSSLDEIVTINSACDSKEKIIDYSKEVAEKLQLNLEGLSASIESVDSRLSDTASSYIPGYYTGDFNKNDSVITKELSETDYKNTIYQFCVTWSVPYDDGISVPVYKITLDISTGSAKLIRVEYFPNTPEKDFTVSDEKIIELFQEKMPIYETVEICSKEYDVVCNNIASIKVAVKIIEKGQVTMITRIRIFKENAIFPELPEAINIPNGSYFPDGDKMHNGGESWHSQIETKE